MGRAKSGGYAGRPMGSTKDRYWLGEGHRERRFNHAMDVCRSTLDRVGQCPKCHKETSVCIEAGVTTKLGARSWWKCSECGHEHTREISPEKMAEYYCEDFNRMNDARSHEAAA